MDRLPQKKINRQMHTYRLMNGQTINEETEWLKTKQTVAQHVRILNEFDFKLLGATCLNKLLYCIIVCWLFLVLFLSLSPGIGFTVDPPEFIEQFSSLSLTASSSTFIFCRRAKISRIWSVWLYMKGSSLVLFNISWNSDGATEAGEEN